MSRRKNATVVKKDGPPEVKAKRPRYETISVPERAKILGQVLVCGQGDMGQLGLGDEDTMLERRRPTPIASLNNVVEVVAGGMHSLVLTDEGLVYSFGCNDEGALGRDCTVEGSDFKPGHVVLPGKAVKISAGDSHSACLLEDGCVYAWGSFRDSHGNMGLTLEGNKRDPVNVLPSTTCCAIASGGDHLVMLTSLGKVFTVGCGEQGQLGRVCMRSASGEGRRGKKMLLQPLEVRHHHILSASEIWASNYCTFLRDRRCNNIWSFGLNNYKQALQNVIMDVVPAPYNTKLMDIKEIAGGQHHTIVLKNDGSCNVIGRCDYGRLGLGDIKEDLTELRPIQAFDKHEIVKVSCGEVQSFALNAAGELYAWGMGSNLQLGNGSEDDVLEPVLVKSKQMEGKVVINVSSGGQHTIFLVKDAPKPAEINKAESKIEVNGDHLNNNELPA